MSGETTTILRLLGISLEQVLQDYGVEKSDAATVEVVADTESDGESGDVSVRLQEILAEKEFSESQYQRYINDLEIELDAIESEYYNKLNDCGQVMKALVNSIRDVHETGRGITTEEELTNELKFLFSEGKCPQVLRPLFEDLLLRELEHKRMRTDDKECEDVVNSFFASDIQKHADGESAIKKIKDLLDSLSCKLSEEEWKGYVDRTARHFDIKTYLDMDLKKMITTENDTYEKIFHEIVNNIELCGNNQRVLVENEENLQKLCEKLTLSQGEALKLYQGQLPTLTRDTVGRLKEKMYAYYGDDRYVVEPNRTLSRNIIEAIVMFGRTSRLVCRIRPDIYEEKFSSEQKKMFEHNNTRNDDKIVARKWRGMKVTREEKGSVSNIVMVDGPFSNPFTSYQREYSLRLYPVNTDPESGTAFERVLLEEDQEQVYETVKPFLLSALGGKDIGLFMYGGSGSGKTYTSIGDVKDLGNEKNMGIVPRLLSDLQMKDNLTFSCQCFEVYGRDNVYHIYDLLHNVQTFDKKSKTPTPTVKSFFYKLKNVNSPNVQVMRYTCNPLNIDTWYNTSGQTLVPFGNEQWEPYELEIYKGADEQLFATMDGTNFTLPELVIHLMNHYRKTAAGTSQNEVSSRSHFIFRLFLTDEKNGHRNEITIGDLAGVESPESINSREKDPKKREQHKIRRSEGMAIKESNIGFIESFKNRGKPDHKKPKQHLNPLEFLTGKLFDKTDSKIMFFTCLYPQLVSKEAYETSNWTGDEKKENVNRYKNTYTVMKTLFE